MGTELFDILHIHSPDCNKHEDIFISENGQEMTAT